jgi:hypothetical protein
MGGKRFGLHGFFSRNTKGIGLIDRAAHTPIGSSRKRAGQQHGAPGVAIFRKAASSFQSLVISSCARCGPRAMLTALRFAREGLFMHDWRIKGALLFDGSGSAPIEADLAMASSVVAAVGRDLGPARRVVDARGLFLAPGLIDLHTPYDAKALGGSALPPSSLRGVTIFVTGNCGFGLAPNTLATRDLLLRNLSGVEGMDLEALQSGVHLGFESFSDDLAALRRCKHGSTWQCLPSTQQSARW